MKSVSQYVGPSFKKPAAWRRNPLGMFAGKLNSKIVAIFVCLGIAAIQVFHPHVFAAAGIGAGILAAGMVVAKQDQFFPSVDKVQYTNTSTATTAGTPVWVAAFGAMIPITDALISASNMYWTKGRFDFVIVNGVTISNGDSVFYVSASGCVTNVDPTSAGFLLGQAVTAGSAAGTATAYTDGGAWVTVDLNSSLLATSGATIATTTATINGNETVGGTLTVTGATSLNGGLAVTGGITATTTIAATTNITAAKITATAGRVTQFRAVSTLNSTGTISAANLVNGIITSTSAAAVTATMPVASAVLALLPGAVVGSSISFLICNSAGANTVTVAASASITNVLAQAGDLAVASGSNISFTLVFTNVGSGTEAAVIYRG